ncbi:DNA-binding protein [Bacteroidia bacterium]|nr:DNA-binding protein [Bacteroidia bacterium]
MLPSSKELYRPFGKADEKAFQTPPKVYHPETYFHFIAGNVTRPGITKDLEALANAGFSGIQAFHGSGSPWPGIEPQIECLSDSWEDAMKFMGEECRRLGLRFTMQNCPGWAMAGGPWIEPSNAMRHLAWSRTDVEIKNADEAQDIALPVPQSGTEEWRDYQDIAVLAFPTPLDDSTQPLLPQKVKSNSKYPWEALLTGTHNGEYIIIDAAPEGETHQLEISFPKAVVIRTVQLPSVNNLNRGFCYEPNVAVSLQAVLEDGQGKEILNINLPQSSFQDDEPVSLACDETPAGAKTYRMSISFHHKTWMRNIRFFTAARKNNWEAEAGWTLRDFIRPGENPQQSPETFVDPAQIRDITTLLDSEGHLKGKALAGKWTILRIGHVNTGKKNGPAPAEGTGWECDKLSENGTNVHFNSYVGRLSGKGGALEGLLNGMLMDSWECETQTWTPNMEAAFNSKSGYELRKWLPAVLGYVVDDHETTARFLLDWRNNIGEMFSKNFYGRMAQLAKDNDLNITYETAAGDVFPADILEYFKYADVPQCEFWQPIEPQWVGDLNFKPIRPTVSAARMYGKPRIAAEAFTSFYLTWDEHLSMLREIANLNCVQGVTHLVFHTYTHNPLADVKQPGTSFGSAIGTPFLRGQTWWKYMPEFTEYIARCNYLFERGLPVSDVLWYLGDEISHKPNQKIDFPAGFKYDYCNPDVLLNRLAVRDGKIVTPEGISYRYLWLPDTKRMLPETLEKLITFVNEGATIIGDAPQGLATLIGGEAAQQRFDAAVRQLWGENQQKGIRPLGKGTIVSGTTIDEVLSKQTPDVIGDGALWMHRAIKNADWYFVCAPKGTGFSGTLDFRNGSACAEIWDPVTGETEPADAVFVNGRSKVTLNLAQAGSCFVVFRHDKSPSQPKPAKNNRTAIALSEQWTLTYPAGWDAPASLQTAELKAWKDLDVSPEAKAFAGTVTYTTSFDAGDVKSGASYLLDLGAVEEIAAVSLNGKLLRTLWTPPYSLDLTSAIQSGKNTLSIDVTSTWFNRLVYDAGLPEDQRKTWVIAGPQKEAPLRENGLLGPVNLVITHSTQP